MNHLKNFRSWRFWLTLAVVLILTSTFVCAREFNIEKLRESFGGKFDSLKELKQPLERMRINYPEIKPLLDSYDNFLNLANAARIEIRGGRETAKMMEDLYNAFTTLDKLAEKNPLKKDRSISKPGKDSLKGLTRSLRDLRYWFKDYRNVHKKLMWRYNRTRDKLKKNTEKYYGMMAEMEQFLYGLDGEPFDVVKPVFQKVKNKALACEKAVKEKKDSRRQKALFDAFVVETEEFSAISNNARYYDFPETGNKKDKNSPAFLAKKLNMMAMELADFTKMKLRAGYEELTEILRDLKGAIK